MPRPQTVLQACTRKRGVHKGAITAAHVAQMAIATAELGHVPTNAEYCDWWALDDRTGWRHRAGVRDVFGDEWATVVQVVADEIRRRHMRAPRDVLKVAVA
jgi:hypothetical protein